MIARPVRLKGRRILETPQLSIHEIGGAETHVHLAATIPPTVVVSDLIGQFKGASSHAVKVGRSA